MADTDADKAARDAAKGEIKNLIKESLTEWADDREKTRTGGNGGGGDKGDGGKKPGDSFWVQFFGPLAGGK